MENIIIGIITGIISSVMVTQAYRIKDRERDRIKFFEEFHCFYSDFYYLLMSIPSNQVYSELKNIHPPRKYSWIHIKDEENAIIENVKEVYYTVSEKMFDFSLQSLKVESELEKEVIWMSAMQDFQSAYEVLGNYKDAVFELDHPEWKIYIDRQKRKKQ